MRNYKLTSIVNESLSTDSRSNVAGLRIDLVPVSVRLMRIFTWLLGNSVMQDDERTSIYLHRDAQADDAASFAGRCNYLLNSEVTGKQSGTKRIAFQQPGNHQVRAEFSIPSFG